MPGMYDESLKGRFFFVNPADARYYAQRQGTLTGNVKSVDVPEKMVNIGKKMADRRRGPSYGDVEVILPKKFVGKEKINICLLYTSPSPRDRTRSRMPSSA